MGHCDDEGLPANGSRPEDRHNLLYKLMTAHFFLVIRPDWMTMENYEFFLFSYIAITRATDIEFFQS